MKFFFDYMLLEKGDGASRLDLEFDVDKKA